MRFFRRGETLNERLLREAGLDRPDEELEAARPPAPVDPVLNFRRQYDTARTRFVYRAERTFED